MTTKRVVRSYTFRSTSSPGTTYTTVLYEDGTASCNCPGWTRRVKNGERTCKHIIAAGLAPVEVREPGKTSGSYGNIVKGAWKKQPAETSNPSTPMRVVRRFNFDE